MNPTDFCNGLLDGNYHRGGIRCLRLFHVDQSRFAQLKKDTVRFVQDHQPSSVGNAHHVTSWTGHHGKILQYSLLNRSGHSDDYSSDHDLSCEGKWFFDGVSYPALNELIADFPHLINFRIIMQSPRSALLPHEEHVPFLTKKGTVGARLRFHLPIETNPHAEINLDGHIFHLEQEMIYLINQGCVHTAYNKGQHARVHLVWDALFTKKLSEFLFANTDCPKYLDACEHKVAPSERMSDIGSYRRLTPPLPETRTRTLEPCEPQ